MNLRPIPANTDPSWRSTIVQLQPVERDLPQRKNLGLRGEELNLGFCCSGGATGSWMGSATLSWCTTCRPTRLPGCKMLQLSSLNSGTPAAPTRRVCNLDSVIQGHM